MHNVEKRFVYMLRSDSDPSRHYVGITNDLQARLDWHNHGPAGHTRNGRPWSLVVAMEFSSERDAVTFEKYLKSGSGRAFAKRHFSALGLRSRPVLGTIRSRRKDAHEDANESGSTADAGADDGPRAGQRRREKARSQCAVHDDPGGDV